MDVMEQLDVHVPVPLQLEDSTSQNLQSRFSWKKLGIPVGTFRGGNVRDEVSEWCYPHLRQELYLLSFVLHITFYRRLNS